MQRVRSQLLTRFRLEVTIHYRTRGHDRRWVFQYEQLGHYCLIGPPNGLRYSQQPGLAGKDEGESRNSRKCQETFFTSSWHLGRPVVQPDPTAPEASAALSRTRPALLGLALGTLNRKRRRAEFLLQRRQLGFALTPAQQVHVDRLGDSSWSVGGLGRERGVAALETRLAQGEGHCRCPNPICLWVMDPLSDFILAPVLPQWVAHCPHGKYQRRGDEDGRVIQHLRMKRAAKRIALACAAHGPPARHI